MLGVTFFIEIDQTKWTNNKLYRFTQIKKYKLSFTKLSFNLQMEGIGGCVKGARGVVGGRGGLRGGDM